MQACVEHACLQQRSLANDRNGCLQVSFEIADVTTCEVKDGTYDVIYSRDTLLHIQDKPALFRRWGSTSLPR